MGEARTTSRGDVDAFAIVVFARIDELTGDEANDVGQLPGPAVARVVSVGMRLIFVSAAGAEFVRRVQRQLNISEPFVCDGGAALHVPGSYFRNPETAHLSDRCCEIFRFNPPDRAAAVTLVRDLFLSYSHDVVTIGIGTDLSDYGMLASVDVPVVVRDQAKEQRELLRHVPGAYLTNATGTDGWSEALIGP